MSVEPPPCLYAYCVGDCAGKTSGERGVLRTVPGYCRVVEETMIYRVPREPLSYSREDGFCVVREPVRAVLPLQVCDYFDEIVDGKPSSRILLGPGGTGKSLTLDLVKRTAPFNVVEVEAESLLGGLVGESEKNLYKVLGECEASEPCLLVMDEADILVESRAARTVRTGTKDVTENLVRIILRRLQKWYNEGRRLGLLGATNLPVSLIEKPLLRAGRLGEPVYFPIPDKKSLVKLAQLYGKTLSEEEMEEILRHGLPHSNVVEYFKTGKLKKWVPEAFASLEYARPSKSSRRVGITEHARIVIPEPWAIGIRLAALISATELGKPVLYLKDPGRLQDIDYLGRSMKFPLAVPYTAYTANADVLLYDYPHPVFFIGHQWNLPFIHLSRLDITQYYGKHDVLAAFCKKKVFAARIEEHLVRCISGLEEA